MVRLGGGWSWLGAPALSGGSRRLTVAATDAAQGAALTLRAGRRVARAGVAQLLRGPRDGARFALHDTSGTVDVDAVSARDRDRAGEDGGDQRDAEQGAAGHA